MGPILERTESATEVKKSLKLLATVRGSEVILLLIFKDGAEVDLEDLDPIISLIPSQTFCILAA